MHKRMNELINREYLLVKIFKSSRKSSFYSRDLHIMGIHHIIVQCESKWPVKCKHFLAFQINHHFPTPFNIVISLHFPAPFSQPFLRTSAEGDRSHSSHLLSYSILEIGLSSLCLTPYGNGELTISSYSTRNFNKNLRTQIHTTQALLDTTN